MGLFSSSRRQATDEVEEQEQPQLPNQPPRRPVGFETVLGTNSVLTGALESKANVRLDGSFEGRLEIDGNILVGETGKIIADINARNIVIAGSVRGNVNGNKVQLLRSSRVWGDISAAAITTEEGAFIDGKITMVKHEASSQSFEISGSDDADDMPKLEDGEADNSTAGDDIEVVVGETVEDDKNGL